MANAFNYRLAKWSSAFAEVSSVTATVVNIMEHGGGVYVAQDDDPTLRVAVNPTTQDCRIVVWSRLSLAASGGTNQTATSTLAGVYRCNLTTDTDFTTVAFHTNVYEATQPMYDTTMGRFYTGFVTINDSTASSVALAKGLLTEAFRVGLAYTLYDITEPTLFAGRGDGFGRDGWALRSYSAALNTDTLRWGRVRHRPVAVFGDYSIDCSATTYNLHFGSYTGSLSVEFLGDGTFNRGQSPAHRIHKSASGQLVTGYGKISFNRSRSYELGVMKKRDPSVIHFDAGNHSGGLVGLYDGFAPYEAGFVSAPSVMAAESPGGTAQSYNYCALWVKKDWKGHTTVSRVSDVVNVKITDITSTGLDVYVSIPTLTAYEGEIEVQLYRTENGGTQFHLLDTFITGGEPLNAIGDSLRIGAFSDITSYAFHKFHDQKADVASNAGLSSTPLLFRQPGTPNTPLDRTNALNAAHICTHKDRVFYCNQESVHYTGASIDGEAPWFSPAFAFEVPGGSGDIIALASMDGVLVVFKKDAVFLVDGDGPPDNGGNGTEFSPPRRIQAEHGCIDARTLVSTPIGLMYRSAHGIELLERGFNVKFIGAPIKRTTGLYPYSGGATFDHVRNLVMFPMGQHQDASYVNLFPVTSGTVVSGKTVAGQSNGIVAVYSIQFDSWTTASYQRAFTNGGSDLGLSQRSVQDLCFAYGTSNSIQAGYVYHGWDKTLYVESPSITNAWLDYEDRDAATIIAPWTLQTGWVKGPSFADRIRVSDVWLLANSYSNHDLNVSFYADYNRSSLTSIKTFASPVVTAADLEFFQFQPSKESATSMSFKITTATPTGADAGLLETGRQLELSAITVRLGVKPAGAMLPVTQKG